MAQTPPVILPGSNDSGQSYQVSGKTKQRFGVIVLGMHRSGTSALARMLNMLGCDLPKTVLPANKNNENGYWESGPVVTFNNELLTSAGSTWQDLRAVDEGWFASPKGDEFRQKAFKLLNAEFGESHLFVLKDPRICRLVPFWLDVLESSGVSPRIILPIRHPLEVMSSSSQMKGLEPAFVSLIWLHHVLEAEYFTRGKQRCFTSYDRLLEDWNNVAVEASRSFGFSWPSLTAKSVEISAFLSQNHRHHSEDKQAFLKDPSVAIWIRETYRIMESWAESGEKPEDFSALDRFRAEFHAAAPAFMTMIAAGDKATKKERRLKTQLDEATASLELYRHDLELNTSKLESAEKFVEESRHAVKETEAARANLDERLRKSEEALEQTRREAETYRERCHETLHKLDEVQISQSEHSVEVTRLKREIETLREELTKARQETEQSRSQQAEAQRNALDLAAHLRQSEETLSRTLREAEEYRERDIEVRGKLEDARFNLTEQGLELVWVKKELEIRQAELAQARQEAENIRDRERELQRKAADLEASLRLQQDALTRASRDADEYRERDIEARTKLEESRNSLAEQGVELAWVKKELDWKREELTQARQEIETSHIRESEVQRNAMDIDARLRHSEDALMRAQRDAEEYRERDNEARNQLEEARSSLAQQAMEFAWQKKEYGAQTEELGSRLLNSESEMSQYRREAEKMVELIVGLEQEKRVAEQTIAALKARIDEIMTEEVSTRSKLKASVTRLQEQKEQLDAEMSRIRADLVNIRKQLTREKALREWMHRTTPLLVNAGSSWKSKLLDLAPARLSRTRQMKQLKREGLFDAAAYLTANPDVAESGIDPLYHYLRHGMQENRQLSLANQATSSQKGQKK